MGLKDVFDHPLVYQRFQEAGGFFGARTKAIDAHLSIEPGARILDIGCGPGFLLDELPADIHYTGYDTDAGYIDFASGRFGARGDFVCGRFDAAAAAAHGTADIVMMNGVLHHLDDDEAQATLGVVSGALGPGGTLFTLDGCYVEGQSRIARRLLDNDRGEFVRTEAGYRGLLDERFPTVEVHIDSGWSRVPYTFIVMVATTAGP
ncbi:MAG: class I SAM-dependent methyltransferase [Actinomycetota bacterium]